MRIRNVHERVLDAPAAEVGELLDSLASPDDHLWPSDLWPRMKLDQPLGVGAAGGHGPIRYTVEAYESGRRVWFRFTGPLGFDGGHGLEVEEIDAGHSRLRHVLEMRAEGAARLRWSLVIRPLHDALLEDALDCAEVAVGATPPERSWSMWVRAIRWAFSGGRAPSRSDVRERAGAELG